MTMTTTMIMTIGNARAKKGEIGSIWRSRAGRWVFNFKRKDRPTILEGNASGMTYRSVVGYCGRIRKGIYCNYTF